MEGTAGLEEEGTGGGGHFLKSHPWKVPCMSPGPGEMQKKASEVQGQRVKPRRGFQEVIACSPLGLQARAPSLLCDYNADRAGDPAAPSNTGSEIR